METKMKTIEEFIKENRITALSIQISERLDGNDSDWDKSAFHYMVTLRRHEVSGDGVLQDHRPALGSMSVPYSKGSAHVEKTWPHKPIKPTAAEVLDCLAMDASGEQNDFESWASDLGYDTDSRKAEAIFKQVQSQTIRLQKFLGKALYLDLIGNVERL